MTSLLGRLMVVAEAYPDLKASQNFQDLQDELSAIEGELQSARARLAFLFEEPRP